MKKLLCSLLICNSCITTKLLQGKKTFPATSKKKKKQTKWSKIKGAFSFIFTIIFQNFWMRSLHEPAMPGPPASCTSQQQQWVLTVRFHWCPMAEETKKATEDPSVSEEKNKSVIYITVFWIVQKYFWSALSLLLKWWMTPGDCRPPSFRWICITTPLACVLRSLINKLPT